MRRIYGGIEFTDWEQGLMDSFNAWMAEKGLSLPPGFQDKHNYLLRFLNTSKGDNQAVYNLVIDNEKWLSEGLIPSLRNFESK